ncbi:MAG: ribbon-helix-helix domain-containing protein [Methanocellales archaeon]|nr:ribbon-helix-helix domain-containing protein [Methanocellales archaeon]
MIHHDTTTVAKKTMSDVRIKMPKPMLEAIDLAIEIGQAGTRSDFIRMAIANQLRETTITGEMKKRKFEK